MRERNNCVDMARGDAIWKNITHLREQYHVPMFPIDLVHIALLSVHDNLFRPLLHSGIQEALLKLKVQQITPK